MYCIISLGFLRCVLEKLTRLFIRLLWSIFGIRSSASPGVGSNIGLFLALHPWELVSRHVCQLVYLYSGQDSLISIEGRIPRKYHGSRVISKFSPIFINEIYMYMDYRST